MRAVRFHVQRQWGTLRSSGTDAAIHPAVYRKMTEQLFHFVTDQVSFVVQAQAPTSQPRSFLGWGA